MSTTIYPPIVLVGAPGAGKYTVARFLLELAGYHHEQDPLEYDIPPSVRIAKEPACVAMFVENGYLTVWVYAPPGYRADRLRVAGRLALGDYTPDDTYVGKPDHTIANIGTVEDLRNEVAELLNRIAA